MAGSPPLLRGARNAIPGTAPALLALLALFLAEQPREARANSSTTTLAAATQQPSCRLSQFFCNTGQCVALDRYCDGEDDCGDKSDEPRYCSPCNRTYFGDVGRTYELEIRRPREDRLPFVCHLNFTAIGGQWGDFVQLTFDTFTVGKFVSFTSEGCPHGHMSIAELDLPATGGQWCGSAWGYTVYFSETRSLNLSLILTRLSEQGIGYTFDFKLNYRFLKQSEAALRYGMSGDVHRGILIPGSYCDRVFTRCDVRNCRLQSPNFPGVYPRNVTCRYVIMQHRVPEGYHATITVRQPDGRRVHVKDRVVQYDRSQRVLRLGDQCNVIQDHLTVYDGFIPDSRRSEALLEAMANKEQTAAATGLPRIKRGSNSRKRVRPSHHDDTTETDVRLEVAGKGPVLARLCGGDAVPDIVSSGPRMLVEFSTSPYDSPFYPAPLSYLPGFELHVEVRMVASTPPRSYTQQGRCEFTVSSFESRQGQLGPPQHSLPANTTCRYEFAGRPTERVWLAFMKYHVAERIGAKPGTSLGSARHGPAHRGHDMSSRGKDDREGNGPEQQEEDDDCTARLRIWDGRPPLQPHLQDNSSRLLGEFCRDESPRLCDHSLLSNSTRFPRPCAPGESYLSSGPTFTLEQHLRYGTALHPVSFVLRYEFVDISQGGIPAPRTTPPYNMPTPTPPIWDCDRDFRYPSNNPMNNEPETGIFRSPRAVFFYGRGGNVNLTCLYRFQTSRDRLQSVRLVVKRARFGERKCVTRVDYDTGRKVCEVRNKNGYFAALRYYEVPWDGVVVARDCICDETTTSKSIIVTGIPGASLLVNFTVIGMNVTQDFTDFYFEGEYTFITPDKNSHLSNSLNGPCPKQSVLNPEGQKLRGSSGDLTLRSPSMDIHSSVPTSLALSGSYEDECQNYPWLIELEDPYNYLYMEVKGTEIVGGRGGDECRTRNRIIIHSAQSLVVPTIICPDETGTSTVAIFSPGWKNALSGESPAPPREQDRSLVIEFLEREPGGPYHLSWLEISRRPVVNNPSTGGATKVRGEALSAGLLSRPEPMPDCPYKCPELIACIAPELWCDGITHCPSGYDELETNCEAQNTSAILDLFGGSLFVVYLASGTAALVGAVLLVLAAALTAAKLRNNASAPGWRRGHNGVMSGQELGPPIEAHKNGAARLHVDDLYGKDSLC